MNRIRAVILAIIFLMGGILVFFLTQRKPYSPATSTLAPAFAQLGKPVDMVNQALTRVLPINSLDEKQYGEAVVARYSFDSDINSPESKKVNRLLSRLKPFAAKPFPYRAIVIEDLEYSLNAFALPGGIILVSQSLLCMLHSEAEVIAILAHEQGHIEKSHCLSLARFELAAKKISAAPVGEIADIIFNFFLRHTYSKTHENEADEYAFSVLLHSRYDPYGMADAFSRLLKISKDSSSSRSNFIEEYFMTHPYLDHREAKYREEARIWWEKHPEEKRILGPAPCQPNKNSMGK